MDDILLYGKSIAELEEVLVSVFRLFNENNLKINAEKCTFCAREVSWLGFKISEAGVRTDEKKIQPVKNMKKPETVEELRSFLGFTTFYSRFIKDYAKMVSPLYKLLKKNSVFEWKKEQNSAFNTIKKKLCCTGILALFDNSGKEVRVISDSSDFATGACLEQKQEDDRFRPVAFASFKFSDRETRYSVGEKEALGIVLALERFKNFLYGRKFKVLTDHKALIALLGGGKNRVSSNRITRWRHRLSHFDFNLEFIKGKENVADALSRLSDAELLQFEDNDDYLIINKLATEDSDIYTEPEMKQLVTYVKRGIWSEKDKTSLSFYYRVRKDLHVDDKNRLFLKNKFVPPVLKRKENLKNAHAGHPGFQRTLSRV